jgi:AcrR family transcriptional regulator
MKRNRTKLAIADAFTGLLTEYTIDKITVKMITDAVGCSRKTFYYYFTDVFELTRYVCDNHLQSFMVIAGSVEDVRDAFLALVNYLNEHRQVVMNMFHGYGKQELQHFTWETTRFFTSRIISHYSEGHGLSEKDLEPVIHMYEYVLFGMLVDWMEHGMAQIDYQRTMDIALSGLPYVIGHLEQNI